MKAKELRNQTVDELNVKEQELRKELFNLRFQSATGEIQNPRRIRQIKKDVARLLTVKTEMAPKENEAVRKKYA
ncbi:50S ribosomal protein L29 [Candidatus Magnetominusculus dajiuhuensis]|uniref:50S ribosomal protein L29 n=1 Tax=Candidatus Magnetominusculus dajiuhuensis TaxID=3137712 RepID=UPI0019DCF22A|nr:50S ribosomal protein L29 [Nitrospirota bacterium]